MMGNEHIMAGSNLYEQVKIYIDSLMTKQNPIHKKIKVRLKAKNSCQSSKQFCLLDFSYFRFQEKNLNLDQDSNLGLPACGSTSCNPGLIDSKDLNHSLHNEELYKEYRSPNIMRVIKFRKLRWTGHATKNVTTQKYFQNCNR